MKVEKLITKENSEYIEHIKEQIASAKECLEHHKEAVIEHTSNIRSHTLIINTLIEELNKLEGKQ